MSSTPPTPTPLPISPTYIWISANLTWPWNGTVGRWRRSRRRGGGRGGGRRGRAGGGGRGGGRGGGGGGGGGGGRHDVGWPTCAGISGGWTSCSKRTRRPRRGCGRP